MVEGAWVQLPLRLERGERVRAFVGERSGGGKEEGWLRVDTMAMFLWGGLDCSARGAVDK